MKGRSTSGTGLRERAAGESPCRNRWEGVPEPWGGNAPPVPAVTGFECPSGEIQVETRTVLFALSQRGSGRFIFKGENI